MKTIIGTSFGLALLLALGVIGAMLAFGMFTTSVRAAPPLDVSNVTFTPASLSVNAGTSWNVTFGVSGALTAGSGTITLVFPKGVVLPDTIEKSKVSVGPSTNQIPLTTDPTVTASTRTVVMVAPATDPDGTSVNDPIDVNDIVKVFFSQLANIKNPAASGAAGTVGTDAGAVSTSADTVTVHAAAALTFTRTLTASPTSAAEGDAVTMTGGGFTVDTGVVLSGAVSGSGTVGSDGKFTITGTMKGASGTVTATDGAGLTATSSSVTIKPTLTATASGKTQDTITLTGKNYTAGSNIASVAGILFGGTAIVTANAVTTLPFTLTDRDADGALDDYQIKIKIPSGAGKGVQQIQVTDAGGATAKATTNVDARAVVITPDSGPPGTTVTVGGTGFPASIATGANNTITLTPDYPTAGTSTKTGLFTSGAGELPGSDTVKIPATALATPITITVTIRGADGADTTGTAKFTVTSRVLTLAPASGPRGTTTQVAGTKFTVSSSVTANTITVGGVAGTHLAVTTDSAGNLPTTSLKVAATTPLGAQTVSATDAGGVTGTATFTVTQPTISLSPTTSSMGKQVTVTGAGWVPASTVTVDASFGGTTVATTVVVADAVGGLQTKLTLPSSVGVGPGVVSFTANDGSSIGNTGLSQTLTLASAAITVDKTSAAVGDTVTVSASGFVPQTGMSALTIGGASVLPIGPVLTNSTGELTVSFTLPGLTGTQLISATIGGTTRTTAISVSAAPPAPPAPPAPVATATVFASVSANADNLVRVWRFSNATQAWALFDPRPEFAAANDLTATSSGDIVWVKVKVQQTFQGKTLFAGWNLISLN